MFVCFTSLTCALCYVINMNMNSIRAHHVNVDAVRPTGSGGSRNEMVRILHVKSAYQLSKGNSKFDAELGKDRKKVILKEMGQDLPF